MLLSTDHKKQAGLSFDNAYAAMKFYQHLTHFVAEPENVSLSSSMTNVSLRSKKPKSTETFYGSQTLNSHRRRHSIVGSAKKQLLKKSEISNPCGFSHVTSLKPHDLGSDGVRTSDQVTRTQSCLHIGLQHQPASLGSAGSSPKSSSNASSSPLGSA